MTQREEGMPTQGIPHTAHTFEEADTWEAEAIEDHREENVRLVRLRRQRDGREIYCTATATSEAFDLDDEENLRRLLTVAREVESKLRERIERD